MRRVFVLSAQLVLALFITATAALAQEAPKKETGHGYAFVGLGAVNTGFSLLQFGGGGEVNFYKGLGMGVELGYAGPLEYLSSGIGIMSLDGQYTFGTNTARKLRPFITGGYSLAFRNGYANALNFGGGVHYWFSNRFGLRLEFRDHVSPSVWDAHFWQGRIGFDIR